MTKVVLKITRTCLSSLLLCLIFLNTIACEKKEALEVLWPAPDFSLTNQYNEPFGTEQLKGHTWVATLFFTECAGPCPMMSGRLRNIQKTVNDPNLRLVSISCNPTHDTPAVLNDYANAIGAEKGRWYFVTGAPEQISRVAAGFNLGFEPATPQSPISHSTRFLLIDKAARVRGIYSTEDNASMEKLKKDALVLAAEQ
jgi:protein SCO1